MLFEHLLIWIVVVFFAPRLSRSDSMKTARITHQEQRKLASQPGRNAAIQLLLEARGIRFGIDLTPLPPWKAYIDTVTKDLLVEQAE